MTRTANGTGHQALERAGVLVAGMLPRLGAEDAVQVRALLAVATRVDRVAGAAPVRRRRVMAFCHLCCVNRHAIDATSDRWRGGGIIVICPSLAHRGGRRARAAQIGWRAAA